MKTRILLVAAAAILAVSGLALAQTMPGHPEGAAMPMHDGAMMQHDATMMQQHAAHMQGQMHAAFSGMPTEPGQAAFGAVQEIVRLLEADPKTDWSKVNLAALREHLIDMNEVVMRAEAAEHPIENGLSIDITGSGRTLDAIRRMIPAHAQELNGMHGWTAKTAPLANGVSLTVTTADPKDVAHIRGLGFIGLLASGSHHQPHHLAMAKGERMVH